MKLVFKLSKKFIIGALVVLVAGGIVFAKSRTAKVTYVTENVSRGAVVHEVNVTGSIAPFKKIDLQPEVSGKVIAVHVTEGDEVKAGDVLIELDARDAQTRIASQRAAIDASRARLAQLVSGATAQELASAQAAVATARSRRDAAVSAKADTQTAYDNAVASADAQMASKLDTMLLGYSDALTAATDAIERLSNPMFTTDGFLTISSLNAIAEGDAVATRLTAKAKLAHMGSSVASVKATGTSVVALDAYAAIVVDLEAVKTHLAADRTVLVYATGLSSTTLATYQANVNAALSSVDAALQSLSAAKSAIGLQEQANTSAVANAKAALSAAASSLETSEKSLLQAQSDLALTASGSRPEAIAAQRALVAADEATLNGLLTDLSKRSIVAPLDGVVTQVSVDPGETVSPAAIAVTINGKGKFEMVANVSEVDIALVAVGQPVRVTLDAFPATEVWTGKVSFIDPAEKVVEGVIFYETKMVFDQEDERLRSGMTANIDIETARREDVLRVPLRALREADGKTTVKVLVADAPVDRDVTTGIEDDDVIEVVSGVSEGEAVIVGSSADKK
jgi:HlyD family secretion protein